MSKSQKSQDIQGTLTKTGYILVRVLTVSFISKLSKCGSSAVICEIMNDDGTMAKGIQLMNFAKKHKLKLGKIDDLIAYRLSRENLIKYKKSSTIPLKTSGASK